MKILFLLALLTYHANTIYFGWYFKQLLTIEKIAICNIKLNNIDYCLIDRAYNDGMIKALKKITQEQQPIEDEPSNLLALFKAIEQMEQSKQILLKRLKERKLIQKTKQTQDSLNCTSKENEQQIESNHPTILTPRERESEKEIISTNENNKDINEIANEQKQTQISISISEEETSQQEINEPYNETTTQNLNEPFSENDILELNQQLKALIAKQSQLILCALDNSLPCYFFDSSSCIISIFIAIGAFIALSLIFLPQIHTNN